MVAEETKMRVVVRVRPNNRRELEHNQRTIVKVIDTQTILFDPDEDEDEFFFQGVKQTHRDITKRAHKKLSMDFDRVFNEGETNEMIFEECTKPLVTSVMKGYNCSVFVYGATGAGKTFTMLGSENCPGLTFLTTRELFKQMTELEDDCKFDIGISYLEVYNEHVMNLLTKTGPLRLCEDSNGVVVNGLQLRPIFSAEELLSLLSLGNKNRTQHPTDANAESSRSHAVFQIHIRITEKKTGQKRMVKLSMIDLAGSERAASTKGIGIRFKEGASINKSLLALGNCINKLADGSKHIPYRDSNLTRLLKDSLGGNCQTVMIANASPSSLTYEDTYNTLKYASRAKKIRIVPKQSALRTNMPKDYFVRKVSDQQTEIDRLKNLIKQLQQQPQQNKDVTEMKSLDESALISWFEKIDSAYQGFIQVQEHYFNAQSRERILKFRAKLKENAEELKRELSSDGITLSGDIARMDASIDRFGKQAVKVNAEIDCWRKRLFDALNKITKLRKECSESKHVKILTHYLQEKESFAETCKQSIKHKHVRAINSLYFTETTHLRESQRLSYKMIKRVNLLLRANELVDGQFREDLSNLDQLAFGQRDIKFHEQECGIDESELEWIDLSFDDVSVSANNSNTSGVKRVNSQDSSDLESSRKRKLFKASETIVDDVTNDMHEIDAKPIAVARNLNETHVLTAVVEPEIDINSTFRLPSNPNQEIINNILTDQNVNTTNKAAVSKALIKSNVPAKKIFSKVSQVVSKENMKKFSPNKVRKSPRPVSRKITSRALASTANFINRQQTKSNTPKNDKEAKAVHINRAASIRLKKT